MKPSQVTAPDPANANSLRAPETESQKHRYDPILGAVLLGFFIAYILLFILPTFLNESQSMLFVRYLPTVKEPGLIGEDAKSVHYFVLDWIQGRNPYATEAISNGIFYPPLTLIMLYPLGVASPATAYAMMLGLTIASFVVLTLWLPTRLYGRVTPIILLFFATGLVSYGFQFELERGQFNVLAVCLCLAGAYLFHTYPEKRPLRYLAYILLTIGIQLKIYPAIFALLYVSEWRDWRDNLRRFALIAAANLALLFVLGRSVFAAFWDSLFVMGTAVMGEKTNHAAASFVDYAFGQLGSNGLFKSSQPTGGLFSDPRTWAQVAILCVVALILILSVYIAAKRHTSGIQPPLFLACTIGALIVPSMSFDYTLAILAAPVAIFIQDVSLGMSGGPGPVKTKVRRGLAFLALTIISALYAYTMFSYTNKPDVFYLANQFPALMLILLLVPVLTLL